MASPDSSHPFRWHYGEMDDGNFQINGRSSILLVVVVFALIILFTVICLYAKWACRYRRLAAALGERSASAAQGHGTGVVAGLDRGAINSLPIRIMGSPANEEPCSICLCNLAKGEKVKVLPVCNHGFHPKCIDKWLKSQASCPICRASLAAEPAQPAALV
ncbi:hypothetical protein Taro_034380 [Colocasia esculenta]|uniref:RING-type domain-containing protein n=1 Tax=Colocasia esculenta TaxID=4460 RepID=A0A843VXM8_COLES|nr:hypothetical protein [Colocasia esculenta]